MGQDDVEPGRGKKAAMAAAAAAAAGAGKIKEAKLDTLLVSLSDIEVFMAFYVVSKLFSSVPALFRVLQGNERFAPLLDGLSRGDSKGMDNGAFHVATAIAAVIVDLEHLSEADSQVRAAIMADAIEVCQGRIKSAVDKARKDDEPLLPKKKKADRHFLEEDIAEYMEGATRALDNAKARVEKAIIDGCKAFKACAGMEKLREALEDLQRKRRYDLNAKDCPASPKFGAVPGAAEHLGARGGVVRPVAGLAHGDRQLRAAGAAPKGDCGGDGDALRVRGRLAGHVAPVL
jgi:hypothetical protein